MANKKDGGLRIMKKRFFSATILMIAVMVFGMFGMFGTAGAAEEPIIINVAIINPMSGPAGPWGQIGVPVYEEWLKLFNKEGFRVNGKLYNFKTTTYDSLNTPEGGAAAAKRAIFEDKIKFIVGHWDTSFMAVQAISNPAKVILIARNGNEAVAGGAYSPEKMPYVVFGTPSQERFISDIKTIFKAYPNNKRVGLSDSTLGKGPGWDYVDKALNEVGIPFHHEYYPFGTTDYAPYVQRFKEAGCDVIYGGGDVLAAMMITKQRWDMGFKNIKTGTAGGLLTPQMYIDVSGLDASQGFLAQYAAPWDYKKTKINPKFIKMCREAQDIVSKKQGKPFTYTAWTDWGPSHIQILAQAMTKAGSVDDPDKIMNAIRGGTFDTNAGKYTMSGAKTYGSPIVFGTAGAMSIIKGNKEVYFGESPWKQIP
jgi:ABC-type branched-subunit amino acid transport system substrate-binding protein